MLRVAQTCRAYVSLSTRCAENLTAVHTWLVKIGGGWEVALGNGLVNKALQPEHNLISDVGGDTHEEAPCECSFAHRWDVKLRLVRIVVMPPVEP